MSSEDHGVPSGGPGPVGPGRWTLAGRRRYDPDGDWELSTAIVYALADARGLDVPAVDTPLYGTVDAAALEQALFGPDGGAVTTGTVEFRHDGLLVRVRWDGWIQVYERTEP